MLMKMVNQLHLIRLLLTRTLLLARQLKNRQLQLLDIVLRQTIRLLF